MKRLEYKDVKKYFEDNGCVLLEKEYKNTKTKMKYKCSCGNISEIRFNDFKKGYRCKKCSGSEKLTFEYVQNYFKEHGCILLETKYINSSTKMKYRCNCGNESEINWDHFKQGCRCKKCAGLEKPTIKYVQNYFKEQDCILLEKEYINAKFCMRYICSCGDESNVSWDNFKKGNRCKRCGINKHTGKNHHGWNPNREYIKNRKIISKRCVLMLTRLLKRLYVEKTNKTEEYLGYSRQELYDHLTTHSNWILVKNLSWDIDHIFPISAFIKNNIFDIKLINSLDNLQPLEHIENLKKGDKYDRESFKKYLATKNIILEDVK